ncbi:MAG: CoA transferase [Proteobacteria bacterium]|jgi:crotonobetainyl-CoA:carnitine CoA-transferase CaiB-like acyl-CoA transferase/flavin reductase (DIM6/NTAB) family NADH-FMN oxidoreductase RutF|nr:CoA transferase [Pseudomonadota bacterium]
MVTKQKPGILKGITVLDLTRMLSGPYCTMMLADHGAEVIKIESKAGDTSRANGPYREDDPGREWAGYFVSLNRSKKSVQLDLKTSLGKHNFQELVKTADVLVENFRPNVMERLGLSYESLTLINPRLVYAAIRGFGDPRSGQSPYAEWPSYDVVAQAMGGIIGLTGPDAKTPTKVGPGVGDIFTGLMMSFGVMAALRHAEATGQGQFVDVGMSDAVLSLCERAVYQHDFDGSIPRPEGAGHPLFAPFGIFPASDGQVAIGIVDDFFWTELAICMRREDLITDVKFQTRMGRKENSLLVNKTVADWTVLFTKQDLAKILGSKIPFGPVNTIKDIYDDPHTQIREMIATVPHFTQGKRGWRVAANPLKFSLMPTPDAKTPPRIGENNKVVLKKNLKVNRKAADQKKYALREAFSRFATGVTVVTTSQEDGTPRGFTANSFTSVSLDPPLLLVCIDKTAHSFSTFIESKHFAINILSESQKNVSGLFASKEVTKFEKIGWKYGVSGVPLLAGVIAHFVCETHRSVDAGDHVVLIGKVLDHKLFDGNPLGYFSGNYFSISKEHSLMDAATLSGEIKIGGVLSRGDEVLLSINSDNSLTVPSAPRSNMTKNGLSEALLGMGLRLHLNFVYAIYRDTETGVHSIFYKGQVEGEASRGLKYYKLDKIPLGRITLPAERSMLERYIEEFRHGSFGFYEGSEQEGIVRELSRSYKPYEIKGD